MFAIWFRLIALMRFPVFRQHEERRISKENMCFTLCVFAQGFLVKTRIFSRSLGFNSTAPSNWMRNISPTSFEIFENLIVYLELPKQGSAKAQCGLASSMLSGSLVGWRPSLLGWRSSLLGFKGLFYHSLSELLSRPWSSTPHTSRREGGRRTAARLSVTEDICFGKGG